MTSFLQDFLSYSPSLVDVLGFLERGDLFHCKLVNRRLYDVISQHDNLNPRRRISLRINTKERMYTKYVDVIVSWRANRSHLIITEQRILLFCGNIESITEYMKEYGISRTQFPVSPDRVLINSLAEEFPQLTKNWLNIEVNGIEAGLRLFLYVLLRQYHIKCLSLCQDSIKWIVAFSEVYRKCHCKCLNVQLNFGDGPWKEFERFCNEINCAKVVISNVDLSDFLPSFSSCNRVVEVKARGGEPTESFLQFITNWSLGGVLFKKIYCLHIYWSHQVLLDAIEGMNGIVISLRARPLGDGFQTIIRRKSDQATLCLHHSEASGRHYILIRPVSVASC